MKYLLDTHVWLWLLDQPSNLSRKAARAINSPQAEVLGVSDISSWEVARKESLGKLALTLSSRVWLKRAAATPGIEMIRVDPEIAWESCHLPGEFHRDPADQIIAATARILDLTLITRDDRLLQYAGIRSLW
jgi:PIN domain nuclease of toxin-antitoxin system